MAHAYSTSDSPARLGRVDWETQRRRVTVIVLIAPVTMMVLLFLVPLAYLLWLSFGGPAGFSLNGLIGPKLRFWPSCGTVPEQIDRIGIVA